MNKILAALAWVSYGATAGILYSLHVEWWMYLSALIVPISLIALKVKVAILSSLRCLYGACETHCTTKEPHYEDHQPTCCQDQPAAEEQEWY